jgi:hypothetical protein
MGVANDHTGVEMGGGGGCIIGAFIDVKLVEVPAVVPPDDVDDAADEEMVRRRRR